MKPRTQRWFVVEICKTSFQQASLLLFGSCDLSFFKLDRWSPSAGPKEMNKIRDYNFKTDLNWTMISAKQRIWD